MKGIADTGFVVAFLNRRDRYHAWAAGLASQLSEPLLTCDAVLSEAAFQLGSSFAVLGLIEDGLLKPEFVVADHLPQLAHLARRYRDRAPGFADLCIIRLSELYLSHKVVTVDGDFRIYRRNGREAIPLIIPRE
ncbi:MAG TPA: PIN domain-containing protein [Terriglobales bacterium]|nr:PIN domain-containing protein [Terriglobales bacterium]